jgi:hypothetical protein
MHTFDPVLLVTSSRHEFSSFYSSALRVIWTISLHLLYLITSTVLFEDHKL